MNENDARCTDPRSFLIFVCPATVIGHRLSSELSKDGFARQCFEIGIIDQFDEDLSMHVLALEVVPAALGRIHSVANEHEGRIFDINPACTV